MVFETGQSVPSGGILPGLNVWRSRSPQLALEAARRPVVFLRRFANRLRQSRYYGNQVEHDRRILVDGYQVPRSGLQVYEVGSVNDPEARAVISKLAPALIYVFGTRLVSAETLRALKAPFANMHWGWSPEYRGEGIVSALALEGPQALGVTVHLLDAGIDSGDVLFQARPEVDRFDNFIP